MQANADQRSSQSTHSLSIERASLHRIKQPFIHTQASRSLQPRSTIPDPRRSILTDRDQAIKTNPDSGSRINQHGSTHIRQPGRYIRHQHANAMYSQPSVHLLTRFGFGVGVGIVKNALNRRCDERYKSQMPNGPNKASPVERCARHRQRSGARIRPKNIA